MDSPQLLGCAVAIVRLTAFITKTEAIAYSLQFKPMKTF